MKCYDWYTSMMEWYEHLQWKWMIIRFYGSRNQVPEPKYNGKSITMIYSFIWLRFEFTFCPFERKWPKVQHAISAALLVITAVKIIVSDVLVKFWQWKRCRHPRIHLLGNICPLSSEFSTKSMTRNQENK